MKKGFTLIEVVGIITILGLLVTFSVPALIKTLSESSEKEYNEYEKNIKLAAESYFHGETDGVVNDKYFIKVGTLAEEGYLKKQVNPKTNLETPDEATITVTKNEDNTENYEFSEKDTVPNKYIDGLTLWYDGYTVPVNNTWKDLIGNNDAALSEFYHDYNSIKLGSLNTNINVSKPYTIEIVFKNETDSNLIDGISINENKIFNTNIKKDKKYTLSIIYNGSRIMYLNGKQIKSDSNASILNNLNFENIKIYSIRVYNKVLSNSNINENYIVDKYRFGV